MMFRGLQPDISLLHNPRGDECLQVGPRKGPIGATPARATLDDARGIFRVMDSSEPLDAAATDE